jgi:hypothetical protein
MDRRRAKRFELRLPLELIRVGTRQTSFSSETKNFSTAGVLATGAPPLKAGDPIEFLVTMPGPEKVRLHCKGRVARMADAEFAMTIERYSFEPRS